MLNVVAAMGRLVSDPELKVTGEGTSVCSFVIASDRDFVKQGEERQADFIDCVAWRNQADFLCKFFKKGSLVAVNGRLQTRNWEDKNGNKRKTTEFIVDHINFCEAKKETKPDVSIEKDEPKPTVSYTNGVPEYYEVDSDMPF